MLPDAAKRPALPQSYLHMPSKPDMPIAHVLAICTVHVQELQRAAVLCLGFPGQRNRSCSYMRLHHVGGVWPNIWPAWWRLSPAQSTADFSCGSACLLWGVLLSVLVILSVLALISIWLTFQSPDILGKWLPSATATTWKVSEQILLLAQLSLHWSDLHCRGRGDLNFQCTTLVYQVKWAKESEVTECPCRLQAAEPSRLSLHTLL